MRVGSSHDRDVSGSQRYMRPAMVKVEGTENDSPRNESMANIPCVTTGWC